MLIFKKNLLEYRGDEIAIKIKNLQEVNSEAFLYYFLRDFGFIDWNNIFKLVHSESGKKVLSESHILFRNKLELILRPVKQIKKIFNFPDYQSGVNFLNAVATMADQEDHHPELVLEWGKVTVIWWSHKIKGLHKNDFICASKTDNLYQN